MRNLLTGLALGAAMACSAADATQPVAQTVAVTFRIDAQTCKGTSAINFYVDGQKVGTETLSAGGSSIAYTTTAAQHILGAATTTNTLTWGPFSANLTGLGVYTQVLTC